MKIGELFFELFFKSDNKKMKDFMEMVGELDLKSVLASSSLGAFILKMHNLTEEAAKTAVEMNNFTQETGLSSERMKQWSNAAERMGLNGSAVAGVISAMQSKLIGLRLGTDQSLLSPMAFLNAAGAGITGAEDPFQFLTKVSKGLHNLSPEIQQQVRGMLGLNGEMSTFINNLYRIQTEAERRPVASKEQIDKLLAYKDAWTRMGQSLKMIGIDIGTYFGDDFEKFANTIDRVALAFHGWGNALKPVWEALLGIVALFLGPWAQALFIVHMLSQHIEDIRHAVEGLLNTYDSILSKTPIGQSMALATQAQRTVSNLFTFHIRGLDAVAIAREVEKVISGHVAKADYQSPLGYR